jgi:uncharacterized protein
MKLLALVLTFVFVASASASAQQSVPAAPAAAAKPSESTSVATTTADQPATKEDVQRYFETMHMRETMQATMDQVAAGMDEVMHERLKDQNLPPELEGKVAKITADALHSISIDDILKAIEPVIQKNYTQRELRALIAFYSTPDGESIQKKQPTVTAETMRVTSTVIQQLQQDLVARIQEELIKAHEQQQDATPKN